MNHELSLHEIKCTYKLINICIFYVLIFIDFVKKIIQHVVKNGRIDTSARTSMSCLCCTVSTITKLRSYFSEDLDYTYKKGYK